MTAAACASGVCAGYGSVPVLEDVNFSVEPGQIAAVLGPNGAGKTTLLSCLAGLHRPRAGTCSIGGLPLGYRSATEAARRGVAYVPDDRGLFFELTVADNLRLGGRTQRGYLSDVLASFPELERLLHLPARLLSGGEQQMLAIGRALASRPRLLIVDELSMGLAPLVVSRLLALLRSFAYRDGIAVILVEQHTHLALSMADQALVLRRGRVALEGPAQHLVGRRDLLEMAYFGEHTGARVGEMHER